jgi:NADPH:quinone reductase-like Zn-dependent oxidoreductase
MYKSMFEFMDKHKIDPYIGKEFAFDEAEKAFEFYEKQNFVGKVAIRTTV